MRYLLTSTLLATQHRPQLCGIQMFGDVQPQLAAEEYKALAGIWRADLKLGPVATTLYLHLAAPQHENFGAPPNYPMEDHLHLATPQLEQIETDYPQGGKVFIMPDRWGKNVLSLHFDLEETELDDAWWSASRRVRAGDEGDDMLKLSVRLGDLQFEGQGQRASGLRCRTFVGKVLQDDEDEFEEPYEVGRFAMRLSLPIKTDTDALVQQYMQRIASRPPPPLEYTRDGFVGNWRLLLSVDDNLPPTYYAIELLPDGSWKSIETENTLAGTWGMYHREPDTRSGWSTHRDSGSSVWLKVHHDRCTKSLRGTYIAGLPGHLNTDFKLWGKPMLETEETEMAARTSRSSLSGLAECGFDVDASSVDVGTVMNAIADRVDGRLWVEEEGYSGRFSLLRGEANVRPRDEIVGEGEIEGQCDAGDEVACEVLL